jgi:hypothetical protein
MDRSYGTLIIRVHIQWVKTHCYKIFRANGSIKKANPNKTSQSLNAQWVKPVVTKYFEAMALLKGLPTRNVLEP